MAVSETSESERKQFTDAELGALAHLYRGEIYRSTLWRTRLDTTTNWAVVTLGVALSISFASIGASPLPLVLVGVLIIFFLLLESRRYRYFNVWRARARWMETNLYAPLLSEGDLHLEDGWQDTLARDYYQPRYHITFITALGRRLRRNYIWLIVIQGLAYFGKLVVHPRGLDSLAELSQRAAIGPIPGEAMLVLAMGNMIFWVGLAMYTAVRERQRQRNRPRTSSMG